MYRKKSSVPGPLCRVADSPQKRPHALVRDPDLGRDPADDPHRVEKLDLGLCGRLPMASDHVCRATTDRVEDVFRAIHRRLAAS